MSAEDNAFAKLQAYHTAIDGAVPPRQRRIRRPFKVSSFTYPSGHGRCNQPLSRIRASTHPAHHKAAGLPPNAARNVPIAATNVAVLSPVDGHRANTARTGSNSPASGMWSSSTILMPIVRAYTLSVSLNCLADRQVWQRGQVALPCLADPGLYPFVFTSYRRM